MDIVHLCAGYNAASHSEEDTRRSGNLSTHCPELAGPDLVSATIGDVGQHPVPSPNDGNKSISTFRPGSATPSVEKKLLLLLLILLILFKNTVAFHKE
jgi:hypothetical protein